MIGFKGTVDRQEIRYFSQSVIWSTVEPRSSGIFGHQEFFRYSEDFR